MSLPDRDDVLLHARGASVLEPRCLSEADAATYLGVEKKTVRRLIDGGQLSIVAIPVSNGGKDWLRRTLIDRQELDEAITRWRMKKPELV